MRIFGRYPSWLWICSASLLLIHLWSTANVASIYAMGWQGMIAGRKGLSGWSALRDLVSISLSHVHVIVITCIAGDKQIITAAIVIRLTREQFKIILLCFFRIRRVSCARMIQCIASMDASVTLLVVVMLIGLMFIPRSDYNYSVGRHPLISYLDVGMRNIPWWVCIGAIWFFSLFWKMVTPNAFRLIANVP